MPLVVKDRVRESSTTSGTGTFTLTGAVLGFQTFSSAIGNGNTTYYAITESDTANFEVGLGTVGAGTLTRDTVLESSNAGAKVNFGTAAKDVFCTYPAEKSVDIDTSQTLANKTFTSSIPINGSTSGSVTLQAPAVAGTTVLTLPSASGTFITTASSGQSIPKAALPTGSVLQVVYGSTSTQVTTSSSSFVDTGLSATITPSSTSSKILVIFNVAGIFFTATANSYINMLLARNGTNINTWGYVVGYSSSATIRGESTGAQMLDSPATTSAVTYKTQAAVISGATVNFQRDNAVNSTMILMEIAG